MDARKQLLYLLENYYKDNYTTDVFADEFSRIYDHETDYALLSKKEHELMRELSIITSRFSPFDEDLKIPNAYFNEADVRKKATEVYLKLLEK